MCSYSFLHSEVEPWRLLFLERGAVHRIPGWVLVLCIDPIAERAKILIDGHDLGEGVDPCIRTLRLPRVRMI